MLSSGGMLKRPRTDYDAPPSGLHPAHEMHHNLARDDDQGGHLAVKDTKTIGSAYDRYLQSALVHLVGQEGLLVVQCLFIQ